MTWLRVAAVLWLYVSNPACHMWMWNFICKCVGPTADTIIKALSEFQVNPDLLPAGLGIIVGEAVTAYTRDAPPETIAKFQAAMLEAMEDEEAKEEEEE